MSNSTSDMGQRIAVAASRFQQQQTGHVPQAVTVVQSEGTLVITLHGALSEAEKALAKSTQGAAQGAGVSPAVVHEFRGVAAE